MGGTRTYVHYFTEEDVAPLHGLLDELAADWHSRTPHIAEEIAEDGNDRLTAARLALKRMTDRVAE